MKRLTSTLLFWLLTMNMYAQGLSHEAPGLSIKTGVYFPDIPIGNLINAPFHSLSINKKHEKFFILNFWGTWCSPCIPEMENLAKLQQDNNEKIQVIAISNDEPAKLKNFIKQKPSKLWLASDTGMLFYQLFGFSTVGQSALVNQSGKVVALVMTDAIDQKLIDRLIKGQDIMETARIKQAPLQTGDIFGVDSLLSHSFSVRGYMPSQRSGEMHYKQKGPFQDRRLTFTNSSIVNFYKVAYNIVSFKQVAFEFPQKDVDDYKNKSTLYCLDLLIKPEQKDSLNQIFQQKLNQIFPVKARLEYRKMPVYILTDSAFNAPVSKANKSSFGFSGRGFDGSGMKLSEFADEYLSNEMDLPVVDETNLQERYDIKTTVNLGTRFGIIRSIQDLGLKLIEAERQVKVLVLYKTEN